MRDNIQQKLARSLTAESTELIPHLPYLLQDFWELGGEPDIMVSFLKQYANINSRHRVLDLTCGKGAVSVKLALAFDCACDGLDLMPEFIQEAQTKASEHGVADRCNFTVGDVNNAVSDSSDYDVAIWCAAGDLLGDYQATVAAVARVIKPGRYILLDDTYIKDPGDYQTDLNNIRQRADENQ